MGDERVVTTIGELDIFSGQVTRRRGRRKFLYRRYDATDHMMGISGAEGVDDQGIVVPMLATPKGPALAIKEPQKGSGNPKPAVPRKEAWALGHGQYVLQSGDTFFGLGTTYLGAGPRWPEIRSIQSVAWKAKNPSPDRIIAGDVILMPAEAQATARRLGVLPGLFGLSPKTLAIAGAAVLAAGIGSYFVGTNS